MRYIEEIGLLLKGLDHRIDGVHAEDPMRKEKWKRLERRHSVISYNDNFRKRGNCEELTSGCVRG